MIAVQAEGCQPVVRAFEAGRSQRSTFCERAHRRRRPARTQAARRLPDARGRPGKRRLRRSRSATTTCSTPALDLAADEGIFAAPEGAACVAAAQKLIESGF